MKLTLLFLAGISLLTVCKTDVGIPSGEYPVWEDTIVPAALFTKADAEKIMGEPAHLGDSSSEVVTGVGQYKSTYTADHSEPGTGKTGNVYFMFEQYPTVAEATASYRSIKESNQDHEGFQILHGLGDEAYFHSDGENFLFILARKGNKMIRMKVNKITGKTSVSEFNAVAGKIVGEI